MPAWKNFMDNDPGEKRGPEKLVNFQGSPPLRERIVHPDLQGVK